MVIDAPLAVRERDLDWVDIGVRKGYKQKYYGFFDRERTAAVRAGSLYAEPEFHSPRHRHTFQQVRFVVSGAMRYGSDTYRAGDCLYIPEGAYYGPVKPVADGNGDGGLHFVDMQFEGPSGVPYPHPEDVVRSREELSEVGSFDDGIYVDADGNRTDGYEAILEHLTGGPIEYPKPRLADYVVARSEAHPWVPLAGGSGIEVKHLGYFFETGPNIKLVRIPAGESLSAGELNAQQVRFLLKGEIEFDGNTYEPISVVYYPLGVPYGALRSTEDSELLVVQWRIEVDSGEEAIPFCVL